MKNDKWNKHWIDHGESIDFNINMKLLNNNNKKNIHFFMFCTVKEIKITEFVYIKLIVFWKLVF